MEEQRLNDMHVPVTSQQELALPLLPEPSRLDLTGPRYPVERLPLPSRFVPPSSDRYSDRLPEPRPVNPPSLNVPFATTSSNFSTILPENRVLSSLTSVGNTSQTNSYQTPLDLYQPSQLSSFTLQTSPPFLGGYPHISSASQNLQNLHLPTGEMRTYEILGGGRSGDFMAQRSLDIPMRADRSLMSPADRLALDNTPMRDDERDLQASQSPLQGDSSSVTHGRSPPRGARNSNETGNVWRPY